MHRLITDNYDVAKVCKRLEEEEFITVDTEFIREKTYYPRLCLIQVAGSVDDVAIDPLVPDIDLTPLFDLLRNPNIVKVFHAARQDIEIFHKWMGSIPTPIYDTQIAAMVCGFGEQVGYEALVNKLLERQIDKGSRFTDWAQRPLSQKQVDYAIADVTHLRDIYTELRATIAEKGRESWIEEEMAEINKEDVYLSHPEDAWKRLKYKNRDPRYLNRLRATAAWREAAAQAKDIPRGRLVKDETVLQIATAQPDSWETLQKVRGAKNIGKADADDLFSMLEQAAAAPEETHPHTEKRAKPLSPEREAMVDVLKLLLKMRCDQFEVASKLVANKNDLIALARGKREEANIRCLQGWRHKVFGEAALRFLEGKLQLRAASSGKGIEFTEV